MLDATEQLEPGWETAPALRRLVLDELNDEISLDEATVDALVRGILSLLESS